MSKEVKAAAVLQERQGRALERKAPSRQEEWVKRAQRQRKRRTMTIKMAAMRKATRWLKTTTSSGTPPPMRTPTISSRRPNPSTSPAKRKATSRAAISRAVKSKATAMRKATRVATIRKATAKGARREKKAASTQAPDQTQATDQRASASSPNASSCTAPALVQSRSAATSAGAWTATTNPGREATATQLQKGGNESLQRRKKKAVIVRGRELDRKLVLGRELDCKLRPDRKLVIQVRQMKSQIWQMKSQIWQI